MVVLLFGKPVLQPMNDQKDRSRVLVGFCESHILLCTAEFSAPLPFPIRLPLSSRKGRCEYSERNPQVQTLEQLPPYARTFPVSEYHRQESILDARALIPNQHKGTR